MQAGFEAVKCASEPMAPGAQENCSRALLQSAAHRAYPVSPADSKHSVGLLKRDKFAYSTVCIVSAKM